MTPVAIGPRVAPEPSLPGATAHSMPASATSPGEGATSTPEPGAGAPAAFAAALSSALSEGKAARETPASSSVPADAEGDDAAAADGASTDGVAASLGAVLAGLEQQAPTIATAASSGDAASVSSAPAERSAPRVALAAADAIEDGVEMLRPEFRARLERVVDRMETEFGHRVEIVETYRSQGRQDALFAQGRTAPGEVVTWTRASHHTEGLAADVVVDGRYDNPEGFARLAQVAREEGLQTLGARDPGHLELASARNARPAAEGSAPAAPTVAGIASPAPVATVATVAQVAPVAQMAPVAQVATVAAVASVAQVANMANVAAATRAAMAEQDRAQDPTTGRRGASSRAPRAAGTNALLDSSSRLGTAGMRALSALREAAGVDRLGGDARPDVRTDFRDIMAAAARERGTGTATGERGAPAQQSSGDTQLPTPQIAHPLTAAPQDPSARLAGSDAAQLAAPLGHVDASERIARLLDAQDAAAERPLSHVVLRIDHGDGSEDRIRVDRRGNTIGATLDFTDRLTADRVASHVGELERALAQQGLETESLAVRSSARVAAAAVLHGMGAEADVLRTGASGQSSTSGQTGRDRGQTPDHDRQSPGSQSQGSSHRHRSRREQKGGS
jgi:hypothetical protein